MQHAEVSTVYATNLSKQYECFSSLCNRIIRCRHDYYHVYFCSSCFIFYGCLWVLIQAVPYTLGLIPGVHKLFWVVNVLMWALFFWLKCSDPGYIKPNEQAFREAQKMVSTCTCIFGHCLAVMHIISSGHGAGLLVLSLTFTLSTCQYVHNEIKVSALALHSM